MPMPVYLITGAIYFIMAYPLSLLVAYFERRTGQSRLRSDLV
jgi:ABC-type amino acid transport system permease subunit